MHDKPVRYQNQGCLHFITFSCYRRTKLLDSAAAEDTFERELERVRLWYGCFIPGYVVMPEHVHLLISEPERGKLSLVIQMLKQLTSRKLKPTAGPPATTWEESARGSASKGRGNWSDSGRFGITTFPSGRRGSALRSCDTYIAIRCAVDWPCVPRAGSGAVLVTMLPVPREWWKLNRSGPRGSENDWELFIPRPGQTAGRVGQPGR